MSCNGANNIKIYGSKNKINLSCLMWKCHDKSQRSESLSEESFINFYFSMSFCSSNVHYMLMRRIATDAYKILIFILNKFDVGYIHLFLTFRYSVISVKKSNENQVFCIHIEPCQFRLSFNLFHWDCIALLNERLFRSMQDMFQSFKLSCPYFVLNWCDLDVWCIF